MRIRSVLLSTLSVLCGLFVGAILLSSCDSGAGLSSLEDMPLNDGLAGKARAWHAEQVEIQVSENLMKAMNDADSLALLAFIEKFPPDWDESVVLSLDGTEEALVLTTTLGEYTDERYDSTMYHVRTLLIRTEPSGNIISGNIVVFSSEVELSKNDFANYTQQFTWNELNGGWSDGSEYGAHEPYGVFHSNLITAIDNIREEYNQPIVLSSGYRCPQGNTNVGSKYPTTSYHMFGRAVDMTTANSPIIFNRLVEIKEKVASNLEHEPMSSYPEDGHLHLEL